MITTSAQSSMIAEMKDSRACWRVAWAAVALFCLAQALLVTHVYYDHPLSTYDAGCQVCLLGGGAAAPVDKEVVPQSVVTDVGTSALLIERRHKHGIYLRSGSPRSPPFVLLEV